MNGVIYCRVSSKEQIEGTSLESQELACQEYAQQHDIRILRTFVERGESAKFADRAQLLELIDFCKKNKEQVQTLLVWKVDRFARNVGDHFNIKATLLKYGVEVVSVTEPIDSKPEGKLMETILAGFAQFDNDIRAMRTVQGMRRKIQEGISPWRPPLGYKSSITNGGKKIQPDEPSQPIFNLLQKAWKEFSTGAYTKTEMCRILTARGVRTVKGYPLSLQSLDNLLGNLYYAGILVDPWSGEEHEGKHVPMISRHEFARVQQRRRRTNYSVPHQRERSEFPLRGVVRCPGCKLYMTAGVSRGRSRRYPYYRCANTNCLQHKSYRAERLHAQFEAFLDAITPEPELVDKIGDLVLQVAQERQGLRKAAKIRKDAELDGLQREIQELIKVRISGLITDQEFAAQKNVLVRRRTNIEAALDSESLTSKGVLREIGEIKKPLSELMLTWRALEPAFRPRFNRLLLPVGYVNDEFRTAEKSLLFRSLGEVREPKSNAVPLKGEDLNRLVQEIQAFAALFRSLEETERAA
jgi:site-specific DNA recombinase